MKNICCQKYKTHNMAIKYYKIRRGRYVFSCTINSDGVDAWRIFFGGKKDCVTLYVQKDKSITTATLGGVRYHKNCIEEGPEEILPRKYTVMMVRTALSFILHKFKHVKEFELLDVSTIKCKTKVRVPLNLFYIAKTGKTWYEAKFGAFIEKEKHRDLYKQAVQRLKDIPVDDMSNLLENYVKRLARGSMQELVYTTLVDALRTSAKKHTRMFDVLKEVLSNFDCIIADRWLVAYLKSIHDWDFENTMWLIPKSSIDDVDMDITIEKIKKRDVVNGGGFLMTKPNIEDYIRV